MRPSKFVPAGGSKVTDTASPASSSVTATLTATNGP
jgi:hypothetical protein